MIIANISFICDICGKFESHSKLTSEGDEIDVYLDKMVWGWKVVWIDENHHDDVCGDCVYKYSSLIVMWMFDSYRWTTRPTPEK